MELMARYPDNHFELAIVDPPYGIGDKFKGGNSGKMNFNEVVEKGWDNETPSKEYFNELKRVSKNQIIWGGNYFLDNLGNTRCFICWDKKISEDFTLAMAELAWTSFDKLAKIFRMSVPKTGGKIHPTQKPIRLYEWLLMNYAKEGDKILDTHLGSGSIALACHNLNFDLTACELDTEYYNAAMKRLKQHQQQLTMF
jgi:site-specific DNA-methyltransferase (adenine-specific)